MAAVDFNILQVIDKERVAAAGPVISVVSVAALCFILIPSFGGKGAVVATLIAFFVQEVYLHLQVRKHFTRKLALSLFLGPVLGGAAMGLIALLAQQWNIWLVTTLGLATYAMVILGSGVVRPSEIKSLARS